jgi:SAM-dependent methyltransferase
MDEYACRICRSKNHSVILDYGSVALAGGLLSSLEEAKSEKTYPLTLVFCEDCKHVQIREILDPSLLFSDYAWETGVGTTIMKYCRQFVAEVVERTKLANDAFVVEIASNDGTLLNEFKNSGKKVRGVDPARRIAQKATDRGIPTHATFFGLEIAKRVASEEGKADLIVGRNVLAHVADLHGLMGGVRALLAHGGTAVIEVPHLVPTYDELQYDQVYHEHIGYHSLDSIQRLAVLHDLRVIDVDKVSLHGGSIRSYLVHKDDPRKPDQRMHDMLAVEEKLLHFDAWAQFGSRVREQKRLLREELDRARQRGEIVVGYGASGKGQALIQFCELDSRDVSYIVDKAPIKHGKWTPGSHIPIFDPSHMKTAGVDILLLFSWNLAEEIIAQEQGLRSQGVRFLHPIPVPHYI